MNKCYFVIWYNNLNYTCPSSRVLQTPAAPNSSLTQGKVFKIRSLSWGCVWQSVLYQSQRGRWGL